MNVEQTHTTPTINRMPGAHPLPNPTVAHLKPEVKMPRGRKPKVAKKPTKPERTESLRVAIMSLVQNLETAGVRPVPRAARSHPHHRGASRGPEDQRHDWARRGGAWNLRSASGNRR